jgi:hypothetical protein
MILVSMQQIADRNVPTRAQDGGNSNMEENYFSDITAHRGEVVI